MCSPHLVLCVLAVAVSGFVPAASNAQSGKSEASPYAFSTRTYSLPSDELVIGFVSKDKGKLRAPALPPPSASHGEQEAFLKRSHEVMKEYLAIQGAPLAPGSLACYDPATYTLSLRAMNAVQDMVESLSVTLTEQASKHVSWRVEVIEAPSADVRVMVTQCQGVADHGKQLDALTTKGTVITTMRGETKGGQHVTTQQGSRFSRPAEYAMNSAGHVESAVDEAYSGLHVELDPVTGSKTLDLNFLFQYWPSAPRARLAQLTAGSSPKIEAEWLDIPACTAKFSSTLRSGHTRLIGVWDMDTLGDPAKAGRSLAAFLCAHVVSLLPLIEPRLEAMLRERGEAVLPTPKGVRPVADPTLPAGMMVRRFRVPPDMESMGAAGGAAPSPADPFASGAAPLHEPTFVRRMTVEDILKAQGIPFPPGSSANFLSTTNELVVRNLPENLDLVQVFVESILGQVSKFSQITVEIIEADASLMRRLTREAETVADHTAAQKTLEAEVSAGKARIVKTMWIETKGGQQASCENVVQMLNAAELGVIEKTPPPPTKKEGDPAPADAAASAGRARLHVLAEETPVGWRIEVDPVISETNKLDLNIFVNVDTSPAGTLAAAIAPEPGIQRLASVNPVRRDMTVKTSIAMRAGVPRLLSVYQPTAPEGQAANVLHAVFVRGDITELDGK